MIVVAGYAPATVVRGPVRQELPYGLFSVVNLETPTRTAANGETVEDLAWTNGVKWEWLQRGDLQVLGQPTDAAYDENDPGTNLPGTPKTFDMPEDPNGFALPFTVLGWFKADTANYSIAEQQAGAEAHLLAFEQRQAEKEFWGHASGDADNRENTPTLTEGSKALPGSGGTDVPPTDLGTAEAKDAVLLLEDHIAQTYGSLGVLHMARSVALELLDAGALTAKGGRLLTEIGTPVVAGSGYPKTHMKSTPALFGRRSSIFTSENGQPLFDYRNNDLFAVAERTYLIGFDPAPVGSVTLS